MAPKFKLKTFQDTAFQTEFDGRSQNYNFHQGSIVKIHNYLNQDSDSKTSNGIGPSFSDLLPKVTKPIELYQPVFKSSTTLYREELPNKNPITIVKELPRRYTPAPIYIPNRTTTISTTTTSTTTIGTTSTTTTTTTTTARPLQRPKSPAGEFLPFHKPWVYQGEASELRETRNVAAHHPFIDPMTLDIPG